jgi:hypothetical protein
MTAKRGGTGLGGILKGGGLPGPVSRGEIARRMASEGGMKVTEARRQLRDLLRVEQSRGPGHGGRAERRAWERLAAITVPVGAAAPGEPETVYQRIIDGVRSRVWGGLGGQAGTDDDRFWFSPRAPIAGTVGEARGWAVVSGLGPGTPGQEGTLEDSEAAAEGAGGLGGLIGTDDERD